MTTRLERLREHISDELDASAPGEPVCVVTTHDLARDLLATVKAVVAWREARRRGGSYFKEADALDEQAAKWSEPA